MQSPRAHDPEGPWIALFCVGVLLTSLSGTTCLGVAMLYTVTIETVQPVLAGLGTGAVLMLGAAARLDYLNASRGRTHRR